MWLEKYLQSLHLPLLKINCSQFLCFSFAHLVVFVWVTVCVSMCMCGCVLNHLPTTQHRSAKRVLWPQPWGFQITIANHICQLSENVKGNSQFLKNFKIFYPKCIEAHCVAKVRLLFHWPQTGLRIWHQKLSCTAALFLWLWRLMACLKWITLTFRSLRCFNTPKRVGFATFCSVFSLCGGYLVEIVDELVAPSRWQLYLLVFFFIVCFFITIWKF